MYSIEKFEELESDMVNPIQSPFSDDLFIFSASIVTKVRFALDDDLFCATEKLRKSKIQEKRITKQIYLWRSCGKNVQGKILAGMELSGRNSQGVSFRRGNFPRE
jgi:hypothetical protein